MKKFTTLFSATVLAIGMLAGCGTAKKENTTPQSTAAPESITQVSEPTDSVESTAPEAEVTTITVGMVSGYKPYVFVDENNEPSGYDVDVVKALDELLPQYEFTFEPVEKSVLMLGLDSDTYPMGIDGFLYTDERAEAYLFSDERIGASIETIVIREDEEAISGFADLAGRNLAPISATSNYVSMVDAYNAEHPDAPIEYSTVEQADRASTYQLIKEGEYDAFLDIQQTFDQMDPELTSGLKTCGSIGEMDTYILFNMQEEELQKAVSEGISTLRENGTLSELSVKWFGIDIFAE